MEVKNLDIKEKKGEKQSLDWVH